MRRVAQHPRPGWQARVEAVGLTFHTDGWLPGVMPGDEGGSYWNEAAVYVLSPAEADAIRDATAVLHELCLRAAHHVAERDDLLDLFGIPAAWRGFVRASLRRGGPRAGGPAGPAGDSRRAPPQGARRSAAATRRCMAGWTWPMTAPGRPACWNTTRTRQPA